MSTSLPPDLRVLCRKLTSIPPAQLPHALPSLINHVLHCKEPLSAPHEERPKDKSTEASQLVHKLKASISTLLNGRNREAHFAAIGLIKAMVDVGGWEVLRGTGTWIGGLLSVIQKADPMASKELAIVTLARIYMLVHPYQTLVREIATPSLPTFITACVALIKKSPSGEPSKTPLPVIETICDAFSALIPLYPTTFRPFASQLRTATRSYLSPTLADDHVISTSLTRAARRLVISLHHVAAKSGGSDEWAKLVDGLLKELHATADQIFRAVDESWDGSNGYTRSKIELGKEPYGGSSGSDGLPDWSGINAGTDRLIGLFQYLSDCLRYPTKVPVTIPTGPLVDAVSRVFLIARLSPKSQTWDQALQTNAAIGREEKEELWSLMPDIHIAALHLVQTLFQRLGQSTLSLAPEVLDHIVRVVKSGINLPSVRTAGYSVLKDLLELAGPTLSKPSVDMLDALLGACCRDLQQDAGHLKHTDKPASSTVDLKKNSIAANADLFLKPQSAVVGEAPILEPRHKAAAAALLAIVPSRVPQQHLKPSLRGLVDQTAILTRNRDAMVSSVLNPFKDQRGRVYPSILPHLTQQFPDDQDLEILRTNLRAGAQVLADGEAPLEELPVGDEEDEEDEEMEEAATIEKPIVSQTSEDLFKPGALSTMPQAEKSLPIQSNPFEASKGNLSPDGEARHRAASPPKRKHEGSESTQPKRQVLEKTSSPALAVAAPVAAAQEDEEDDDDDESVHLNMELDDDEEDDDE
ncbi:rRNA processing/ribosome biogenesis-domain-containing protein [Dactylonectria estremocensis]|uniref:Pre-rRNA-processing protein RIX1 n=1 Tax=Dactylonectria estremocensis TaxID=1079267 RepID=A0A9P9FJP7_9HYPO|nr:rRNA processing/ribosome biogenesis-domain-containing protein [Dactylonectria estremocensis]